MPSIYLIPDDYATYGLPASTTEAQVIRASAIIDGYLSRPDGLIYTADIDGNPLFMTKTGAPIVKVQQLPYGGAFALAYGPVVALISVQYNTSIGLPPIWENVQNYNVQPNNVLYLSGYLTPYVLIKVSYVCGWTYATLPDEIKIACATIILTLQRGITISATTKIRAGQSEIDFDPKSTGGNVFIDEATASMLNPYKPVFY